jgi:hypothetical protein
MEEKESHYELRMKHVPVILASFDRINGPNSRPCPDVGCGGEYSICPHKPLKQR